MRNDRQMIFHEASKGQGESLPTNDNIPTHHEDTEEDQDAGDNRSSGRQARQQQHQKRQEVAKPILIDKNLHKVMFVDDHTQGIPGLDCSISTKNHVEDFKGNCSRHEDQQVF